MLVLFRKDELLYVKCNINLKRPVRFHEKVFEVGNHVDLLLPEEVIQILTENGNIRLWNGKKFIKLNLGEFYDIIEKNQFKVVNFVEPKKEQPVQQPKVEQPKKEEVKIVEPKKEEPVQQPKVEQPKKEEVKQNDNKKQRHNNNNKPQNSGGDK